MEISLHVNFMTNLLILFQSLEKNEGTLNQLKERNAELEKDVERVRQRDELRAKVNYSVLLITITCFV